MNANGFTAVVDASTVNANPLPYASPGWGAYTGFIFSVVCLFGFISFLSAQISFGLLLLFIVFSI